MWFWLLLFNISCQSSISLLTLKEGEYKVLALDEFFQEKEDLGILPQKILDQPLLRYKIVDGLAKAVAVAVVMPRYAKKNLIWNPDALSASDGMENVMEKVPERVYPYVNNLLRAHRLLLKKNWQESEQILDQCDREFGQSYGTLSLRAQSAWEKGDRHAAWVFFRKAQRLSVDTYFPSASASAVP